MGSHMVFAMVLACDLDSIHLDGIVIRPGNNGEADVIAPAQDESIKGADSSQSYQHGFFLKIQLLCDHIRSQPVE